MRKRAASQLFSAHAAATLRPSLSRQARAVRPLAHLFAYLCLSVAAAAGLYVTALVSAGTLLVEREVPAGADVIVVLGGDGPPRAERAAELWHQGFAPSILATGHGDCDFVREMLIADGVDATAIATECRSQTTWDNAGFSRPILARMRVQRAILVTSWFHSGRAVKRFRSSMPSVEWISVPVERTKSYRELAFDVDGVQVFKEYAKTIGYDLRRSISDASATGGAAPKTSRLP